MMSANITIQKNSRRISKESEEYVANSFDKRNGDEVESSKPFSGRSITEFRVALNKTQPQFAEDLSRITNEEIDVETLDLMEKNYTELDDGNPAITSLSKLKDSYLDFHFTGKTIKRFRLALNKTQPQFARELSFITGEKIDVKMLCRMETYGERDACHSLVPPLAVFKYIFYNFPTVSRKGSPYPRGNMKRHYYIRNRRCEVEQLDGVVAIKVDRNTRSQMPPRLNTEQLHVSPEELEVFENAGWIFSSDLESSDLQRGSSVVKDLTPSGAVFRREDGGIMIGTKVLTVKLKEEFSSETVQRKLAAENLSIKRHLKFAPNLFEVSVSAEADPITEANKLRDDEDFIYAEPVMIEHMAQRCRFTPKDPDYDRQWQWNNNGSNGALAHADVSAEIAWSHSRGQNVRIAVIDNGFDVQHQDLRSGIVPQSGYFSKDEEFVQGLTGYPSNDHGTFCAGIAGARANNGFGGCGIAFESDLLLIACLEDQTGTQNTLARAIAYAANPSNEIDGMESMAGADIISCSLGPNNRQFRMQSVLEDAIKSAISQGRNGVRIQV
jgi:DNA-binding transcriptional regulator YiaG